MIVINSVSRVQVALDALHLGSEIRTFAVPTGTAQEAADAIGCALGAIVKSLCFIVNGEPVLVLAAGDKQVDSKALRRIFGVSKRQVKIADVETVRRVTGFEVGGVAPFGHLQPMTILIDRSLSRFETVYAAAGSSNTIFPIAYADLVASTGGQGCDLVKEKEEIDG
ncbi:MAG: YbaK/EbsC family protein [Anaerolineae bacterium]|nr:YbaK/EbsC family protein [Anaerolineae bacterium]